MKAGGYAASVACGYALVAGGYIAVSSRLAADVSASVEDLAAWETTKGFLFVGTTALLLFVGTRFLFRRLTLTERDLARGHEALRLAEQRATPGLLAASIAHDLNNMLTVASSASDELRAEGVNPTLLDELDDALRRSAELARRLSRTGRGEAGRIAEDSVGELVAASLDLLGHLPAARARRMRLDVRGSTLRRIYPSLVEQVLTNLIVNALQATREGGAVLVRVLDDGDVARLEVHDDGPGFPDGHVVEPFVTTKEDGTGLGLVSVRACARAHGGTLEVGRSEELGGARVCVSLARAVELGSGA